MVQLEERIKVTYLEIGQHMKSECRLPDSDLVYFLTYHELLELAHRHSPKLVRRAQRRRQLLPTLEKLRFAELHCGRPVPINQEAVTQAQRDSGQRLEGTPVSRGRTTGRAFVAQSIADISQARPGDILITHHTDIGWSPIFPLLAGLVTETGGIISHGAVIARECNIPCIVNVDFATDIVETGETVCVDGTAGYLERLDKMEC